eukprot:m.60233 g.60233  ORF g.60233 m.60233 type:complete len:387 (+) comp34925_c1_seq6:2487-3647(+)
MRQLGVLRLECLKRAQRVPSACLKIQEFLINDIRRLSDRCFMTKEEFKDALKKNVLHHATEKFLDSFVDYLNITGAIACFREQIVVGSSWLCSHVIGPLLTPDCYPVPMRPSGHARKADIACMLEDFTESSSECLIPTNKALEILRHLEIIHECQMNDEGMFIIPALMHARDMSIVWGLNSSLVCYTGCRLHCREETDIIAPGFYPALQCQTRAQLDKRATLWNRGIKLIRISNNLPLEVLVELQDNERAIDIICRGPPESDDLVLKLCSDVVQMTMNLLVKQSPGTVIDCKDDHLLKRYSAGLSLAAMTDDPAFDQAGFSPPRCTTAEVELLSLPGVWCVLLSMRRCGGVCRAWPVSTIVVNNVHCDRHECKKARRLSLHTFAGE